MAEYKISLLGDGGVGKTTFLKKAITGKFDPRYLATLGCVTAVCSIGTSSGVVKFNFYDFGGQEKFGGTREKLISSDAVILMFDVSSRITFKNIRRWCRELQNYCTNIPIILCGMKIDDFSRRKISYTEAQSLANEKNFKYCEISNKLDVTILLKKIYKTLIVNYSVPNLTELCRISTRQMVGLNSPVVDSFDIPKQLIGFIKEYTDKRSASVVHMIM